jgi:hypothetical protein
MFKLKVCVLSVWALITRRELVYVKARDSLGASYTIYVKIAENQFDPFSDEESPLTVQLHGFTAELMPDGTTSHGGRWCYVNKNKRTAQKLAWS